MAIYDINFQSTDPIGAAPLTVDFTADYTNGGDVDNYRFDFGDGTSASAPGGPGVADNASRRTVSHTYTVTSEEISAVSISASVVEGATPLTTIFEAVPYVPFDIILSATSSAGNVFITTAQNYVWVITAPSGINYHWDFGDGTSALTTATTIEHIYTSGRYNQYYDVSVSAIETYDLVENFDYQSKGLTFFDNWTYTHYNNTNFIISADSIFITNTSAYAPCVPTPTSWLMSDFGVSGNVVATLKMDIMKAQYTPYPPDDFNSMFNIFALTNNRMDTYSTSGTPLAYDSIQAQLYYYTDESVFIVAWYTLGGITGGIPITGQSVNIYLTATSAVEFKIELTDDGDTLNVLYLDGTWQSMLTATGIKPYLSDDKWRVAIASDYQQLLDPELTGTGIEPYLSDDKWRVAIASDYQQLLDPDVFLYESSASDFNITATSAMNVLINHKITNSDFIQTYGPKAPIMFETPKTLNIRQYLPQYYNDSNLEDFIGFFEDYCNEMFDEYASVMISATSGFNHLQNEKISILEKIKRIGELHDPELMDIDYLQHFANHIGYNISINRGDLYRNMEGISDLNTTNTPNQELDDEKYLRFLISNLPYWYKIKGTKDATKIMLYSFGIIGDLVSLYAPYNFNNNETDTLGIGISTSWSNYYKDKTTWKSPTLLNPQDLDQYYPLPHFALDINLDNSQVDYFFNASNREKIISYIENIVPINTVFARIDAWAIRVAQIQMDMYRTNINVTCRASNYINT